MQRLKLEHGRELRSPTQLVGDNIGGDLGGKRQRESHKSEDSTKGGRTVNIEGAFAGGDYAVDMRSVFDEQSASCCHSRCVAEARTLRLQSVSDAARLRSSADPDQPGVR